MNRFCGDESWRRIAYAESRQTSFLFEPDIEKQSNDVIAAAYRDRLKKVAGFKYVPEPLPMKNSNKATLYYLFFGSAWGATIPGDRPVRAIFEKLRLPALRFCARRHLDGVIPARP
jgi:hypothetical protein